MNFQVNNTCGHHIGLTRLHFYEYAPSPRPRPYKPMDKMFLGFIQTPPSHGLQLLGFPNLVWYINYHCSGNLGQVG